MPVQFADLTRTAPLNGLFVRTADGKIGVADLKATAVVYADGKSVEQKATEILASITDVNTALGTHGGDITAVKTSLGTLETTLNEFLTGDPNGGEVNRLKELVAEISVNRDSIDAITSSKVAKSDIIDNLTTSDATRVLSAAQGMVLKGLLDALEASVNTSIAGLHTHSNKAILDALSLGTEAEKAGKLLYGGEMIGDMRLDVKVINALPENNVWPADMKPTGVMFYLPTA